MIRTTIIKLSKKENNKSPMKPRPKREENGTHLNSWLI